MNVKKIILLSIALLCLLSLYGCAADTTIIFSDDLIYDAENIDRVAVGVVVGPGEAVGVDINDEEEVNKILELLKDNELEDYSLNRANEIYKNAEIWSQKVKYQISLVETSEIRTNPNEAIKGFVIVLEDGNLLFVDPSTIGQIKKPHYYISTEKQTENINRMIQIIEKSREPMKGELIINN